MLRVINMALLSFQLSEPGSESQIFADSSTNISLTARRKTP